MRFDFSRLSGLDFEELVHDLLQVEWDCHLEIFRAGRDRGIDLRGLEGAGQLIVQCKNYQGSTFAALRAKIRDQEAPKVQRLAPARYVLVTSLEVTSTQKDELFALLVPYVRSAEDVIGGSELVQMLERHPDIIKRHHKLWLTSVAVLERVLHAAEHEQTKAQVEHISRKMPLFVQTNAYARAMEVLDQQRVAIISGVPGIGKSTLADMLVYAHIANGYAPAVIKNGLAEGRKLASSGYPTIFYFDDFLGETFLGDRPDFLGRKEDADLVDFIEWIRTHESHRFVLTSREHVLADALQRSERLRHAGVGEDRCVITVADFQRTQRARILYNHIYFSKLPPEYRHEMLRDDFFLEIVDCKKFNPRIVEWLSNERRLKFVRVADYQEHVRTLLDNPHEIWRHAFTFELSPAARDVLVARHSLSFRVYIDDLEKAFDNLHVRSISRTNQKSAYGAYRAALKELEGSFIEIADGQVNFINPSVRDFVSSVIQDNPEIALDIVDSAVKFNQLSGIWSGAAEYGTFPAVADRLKVHSRQFIEAFARVIESPALRWISAAEGKEGYYVDLESPDKVEFLIELESDFPAAQQVTLKAIKVVVTELQAGSLSINEVTSLLGGAWRAQQRKDSSYIKPVVDIISDLLNRARGCDWLALLDLREDFPGEIEREFPDLKVDFDYYIEQEVSNERLDCNDRNQATEFKDTLTKLQERHGVDLNWQITELEEMISEMFDKDRSHKMRDYTWRTQVAGDPEMNDDELREMFRTLNDTR